MHLERKRLKQQLRALPETSLNNIPAHIKNDPHYRGTANADLVPHTYEAAEARISNEGKFWSAGNVAGSSAAGSETPQCLRRHILEFQTHTGK